jgi:hypothetical protein
MTVTLHFKEFFTLYRTRSFISQFVKNGHCVADFKAVGYNDLVMLLNSCHVMKGMDL